MQPDSGLKQDRRGQRLLPEKGHTLRPGQCEQEQPPRTYAKAANGSPGETAR